MNRARIMSESLWHMASATMASTKTTKKKLVNEFEERSLAINDRTEKMVIRVGLPGGFHSGGTVVTIPYVRPEVPDVSVGRAPGVRLYWNPPSATDHHGTWYWHNPSRSLLVTLQPGGAPVLAALTNLVMISIMISIANDAFWTSSTEEFLNDVTYSLGLDATKLVVLGAESSPSRRALASASRRLWLAWLAPDADAATLERNRVAAQQFFSAAVGATRFGNISVAALLEVYVSGPLCDLSGGPDGTCTCPDTGETIALGNGTCLRPALPPPPPPPPSPPPAMPRATARALSAAGLCAAVGALLALPLAACLFRAAALRKHTATPGQVPPPLTLAQVRERLGGKSDTGVRVWMDKQI